MAITRAQAARQLLQSGGPPGGGDPGMTYDGGSSDRERGAEKSREEAQFRSDIRKMFEEQDIEKGRGTDPETGISRSDLEAIQALSVPKSGLPGVAGTVMDIFRGPRQKALDYNVNYFVDLTGRRQKDKFFDSQRYSRTAQGYKNYMADRQAGIIDAAGNRIVGSDDDDDNIILPINRTFNQSPLTTDQETDEKVEEPFERALAFRADGGRIGAQEGGIMNANVVGGEFDFESARQMYGLGKLVKKVTRTVKKIAKSPIGKAALLYAGGTFLGGLQGVGGAGFGSGTFLSNLRSGQGIANLKSYLGGKLFTSSTTKPGTDSVGLLSKIFSPGGAIIGSSIAAGLTADQEDEAQLLADNTGIDIGAARNAILQAAKENYAMDVRARGFKAEGGPAESKEPVAKKTMPLLDMGGQEMDLRAEGGFVPIGRMEKADDVPARLSKNEFVFTADAVRGAGNGSVEKGAQKMYDTMKNLERRVT